MEECRCEDCVEPLAKKCKEDEPLMPYEFTEFNMDESLQPEAISENADESNEALLPEAISKSIILLYLSLNLSISFLPILVTPSSFNW